jgi:outer membrane protein assembly factor BamB
MTHQAPVHRHRSHPRANVLPLLLTFAGLLFLPWARADWPTHRANAGRTGLADTTLSVPLQPAWTVHLAPPRPAWSPPARRSYWQRLEHLAARVADDHSFVPVIAGNALLCGSSADDQLRCFEADSGQLRWSFSTDGPVRYAPALADDVAYVGSDDGWIYALRIRDGSLLWRHRPGPEDRRIPGNDRLISVWPIRSGVLVDRGTVFATAGLYPQQGVLACALNATNGAVRWQQSLDVSPEGYLLRTDNLLIVPTGRASPIGLDRETGQFVRAFDTGGGTYAVASQGELFGGPGNQGSLAAIGTQSGQRLVTVQGRNLVADGPSIHLLENGRLRTIDRAQQASVQRRIRDLEGEIRKVQARSRSSATNGTPGIAEAAKAELNRLGDTLADERRLLEACELWTVPCLEDVCLIGTRNLLITGGTNRVAAFDRQTGQRLWEAPVQGKALALAATDRWLAVATDQGSLQVFGASVPGSVPTAVQPSTVTGGLASKPPVNTNPPPAWLKALSPAQLSDASEPASHLQGYALVAGIGSGRFITDLLDSTALHVVVIDTDSNKTAIARAIAAERGLYGSRLSAHILPSGPLPFTDYFANLVLSEASLEGSPSLPWPDNELERVTRPFGGIRWTNPKTPPLRRGPLEGAGEWTHQFANPSNTSSSGDRRIHANLALQWFGGPGPDLMVDRHLRGPAPLTSQGRLFVPGENRMIAVDAYNGTLLWQRELPGSQRYSMPYDAGYFSLSSNALAVAVQDRCWFLHPETGDITRQWPIPAIAGASSNLHWGYTVLLGDQLFGTTQKATASRTRPGYEQIDVDYNNDQPLVTGLALFQIDATTGRTVWHRQRGVLLNTTLTLSGNRLLLVEARDPELVSHPTGRIPLPRLLQGDPWLVALDASTGAVVWEKPIDSDLARSRNILYLAASGEDLIVLGSHLDAAAKDTRYTVESRRLSDGSIRWTANHLARVPGEYTHGEQVHHPVILNDLLVAEPAVYDLASGRRLPDSGGVNPWNLIRPGHSCGTLSAAGDCLFFRAGNPTVMDLRANLRAGYAPTKLSPSRTGCWINMIPAGGLLLIPEASAGCVCQFSLQTSMAFLPRSP